MARATQAAGEIHTLFSGVRPVYLLYRGHSKGAAYCGRLVLEEVARTPAIAMGAAEFRQGPNEVIDQRFGAVVFAPDGKQGELNRALAADIQRSGGRVMLVGSAPESSGGPAANAGLEDNPGLWVFPIPAAAEDLRAALEVVPVQSLAYQMASAQGYPPGQVRYISKVILTEEGIPNEG
ncbi:MAG: hypothetical protein EHM21_07490 [Chloroflexi bacterium]|nr:MAG: hypothetical protein EHM21_07490 [Chloroflexota bacterium]